jgi:hypothetical protein
MGSGSRRRLRRDTALTLVAVTPRDSVVIVAWAGHKDAGFTLRRYAHNQTGQLDAAASSWERIVRASAREAESGDGQNQWRADIRRSSSVFASLLSGLN